MPRCGDASGTLPDGEQLAGVRALCDGQCRTVCFSRPIGSWPPGVGGREPARRELPAGSLRASRQLAVFLSFENDWRSCIRLREGTC